MPFTHDIFISYGHLDDVNPFGQDKGWVDLLHERLLVLVGQALGYEPTIWRDGHDLQGNDRLVGAISEGVTSSLLLVPIITPRYVQSEWCNREMDAFHGVFVETAATWDRHQRRTAGRLSNGFRRRMRPTPDQKPSPYAQ